jgi:hypothetical protein
MLTIWTCTGEFGGFGMIIDENSRCGEDLVKDLVGIKGITFIVGIAKRLQFSTVL